MPEVVPIGPQGQARSSTRSTRAGQRGLRRRGADGPAGDEHATGGGGGQLRQFGQRAPPPDHGAFEQLPEQGMAVGLEGARDRDALDPPGVETVLRGLVEVGDQGFKTVPRGAAGEFAGPPGETAQAAQVRGTGVGEQLQGAHPEEGGQGVLGPGPPARRRPGADRRGRRSRAATAQALWRGQWARPRSGSGEGFQELVDAIRHIAALRTGRGVLAAVVGRLAFDLQVGHSRRRYRLPSKCRPVSRIHAAICGSRRMQEPWPASR